MSKFNSKAKIESTTNVAGGISYERNTFKKELVSVVFNTMLKGNSYYESEADRIERIFNLIDSNTDNIDNARFLAKTLVYTRDILGLRSISHLMAVALTEKVKGKSFVRKAIFKAIIRPDDMLEIFSLWKSRNNKGKMSNSMRRAFVDALEQKFDEYNLKKYEAKTSEVKLKDIVKLVHPSSKNYKDKNVFKKLIEGTLDNIVTAQTINASTSNKNSEDRSIKYSEALINNKLGIMAALKNIKNILNSEVDDKVFDILCNLVSNKRAILKSRILPFRFYDAYKIVSEINMDRIKNKQILKAIENGFMASSENIDLTSNNNRVALLLDESCSMTCTSNSIRPFEIGKVLMASCLSGANKNNIVGYFWANNAREVSVNNTPMEFIKNNNSKGGGTLVSAALEGLINTKTVVDRIIIFTDMQLYHYGFKETIDTFIKKYKKFNDNVKIVWWNLGGYDKGVPTMDKQILEVSGYSDKMLEIVDKMLTYSDPNYLIKEIEEKINF